MYVKPGELVVADVPTLLSTVLGSCVAVIMHVPEAHLGAMCHAMLPSGNDDDFRYVDSSVAYMAERLRARCGPSCRIDVKLFGGAEILNPNGRQGTSVSIGRQNVDAAVQALAAAGLQVAAAHTGGSHGRKLFFYTDSGEVFMRQVKKSIP